MSEALIPMDHLYRFIDEFRLEIEDDLLCLSIADVAQVCICSMWLVIAVVTLKLRMVYMFLLRRERSAHLAGKLSLCRFDIDISTTLIEREMGKKSR